MKELIWVMIPDVFEWNKRGLLNTRVDLLITAALILPRGQADMVSAWPGDLADCRWPRLTLDRAPSFAKTPTMRMMPFILESKLLFQPHNIKGTSGRTYGPHGFWQASSRLSGLWWMHYILLFRYGLLFIGKKVIWFDWAPDRYLRPAYGDRCPISYQISVWDTAVVSPRKSQICLKSQKCSVSDYIIDKFKSKKRSR